MDLASSTARHRVRAGLWVWALCLTLCLISYPAAAVARASPWAGVIGGLLAVASLLTSMWLGYSRNRPSHRWQSAARLSTGAATLTGLAALSLDQHRTLVAGIVGLAVGLQVALAWLLAPRLAEEAESAGAPARPKVQLLPRGARGGPHLRPCLLLALLLGFVTLGLGAAWTEGARWAPNPAGWFVGLALAAFAFMLAERMSFFERSAREGNLVTAPGSFSRWLGWGALFLAAVALIAAVTPWKSAPPRPRQAWVGNAVETAIRVGPAEPDFAAPAGRAIPLPRPVARAVPHRLLPLLLLLLLLVMVLALVWGFSRTRAVRWLLALIATALSRLLRAWRRLLARLRPLSAALPRRAAAAGLPAPDDITDPLRDIFDDPGTLARLSPREVLVRTYHLLLNFAEMLGHGRSRGQTPFEYGLALEALVPGARDALRALTWGYASAMYAHASAPLPPPGEVKQTWDRIAEALRSGMSAEDLDLRRRAYLATRSLERHR